jgi:serine/threonine protein kinase
LIDQTISHYKILEQIGEGGTGVVYKAEDTKLKRTVALKFLSPQLLANETEKRRFLHEAQAADALNHPHINGLDVRR